MPLLSQVRLPQGTTSDELISGSLAYHMEMDFQKEVRAKTCISHENASLTIIFTIKIVRVIHVADNQ